uniref:Ig-like domain-containing protein n=1 Tax=Gadus morhua TaxID=8049 RepID=A0A8C5B8U6_GADMO
MTSSAAQEVKQNLISTVGGEVTIPEPVKSRGILLKKGVIIAEVKDSVLELKNDDFLNRISWDGATGLFTIRRLQSNDSGDYAVNDIVTLPGVTVTSVSSERCTLLCAVDQLSGGTLSWYQGEVLVIQSSTLSTQRSLPLTVDRLGLRSSYRCVSANPAGNLTRSVDANTSCTVQQRTGKKLNQIVIPIVSVMVLLSICAIVIFFVKRRKKGTHLQGKYFFLFLVQTYYMLT